jgi:hypothetical protein
VVTVGSDLEYSLLVYDRLNLPAVWQQRTYAWNGTGFAQTAGPTSFAANPTVASFTVQAAPVTLGRTGDFWDGSVKVTVRSDGPQAVRAALGLAVAADRRTGGDWARCETVSDDNRAVCDLGTMAAGSFVTLTLPIRSGSEHGLDHGQIAIVAVQTGQFQYEPVMVQVANP